MCNDITDIEGNTFNGRLMIMDYCITTRKDNSWYIGTEQFNSKIADKTEAIMFQGNGYFGIRASAEERQLGEKRNMFVSGTFDAFSDEVTELPNLPDILNMEIKIDGQMLCLKDGQVKNYHKGLNMKNGELIRHFDWIINGKQVGFKFSRFISMDDVHLFVSKLEIMSNRDDLNIQIQSGIDGQQSNSGTQHLIEGNKRLFEDKYIQMQEKSQQSGIDFVFNVFHRTYIDEVLLNVKPHMKMGRRQIFGNYEINLPKKQRFTLIKYSNIYTSIDSDVEQEKLSETSISDLKEACLSNYVELLNKSAKSWQNNIWQRSYVKISSEDVKPQVAINFARYQLAANTPPDSRMNIGAKGITGEGYKGHTFWDTEIFMLPYYIFTMPEIARNLLKYRYLGLEGAHKKAKSNGYEGAQFPWEMAWPTDGETTPLWGSADIVTGRAMKIWSGFIEQHVTSDIAIAVMEYLHASGDQEFAEEMGYEIILDAAKFWSSRLEYDQDRDRYEITNVIGPDEYKEHADNNAFTNYTASWCIKQAVEITDMLRFKNPALYEKLNNKLKLDTVYQDWMSRMDMIYLPQPNEDLIIPQDDKYLGREKIDVAHYQSNDKVSDIFKEYNLAQINQLQITKQADVLLLLFLFENLYDKNVRKANWDYYEPKTTHDSSLSPSTHSILANDLELDEEAYRFFEQACETDLGTHVGKAEKGLHMAALGGIWNIVVEGFGGVRIVGGKLRIQPHLPQSWDGLQYQINWQGSLLKISVNHEKMQVEILGDSIEFINHDKTYQVPANSKIEVMAPLVEV